MTEWHKLFHEAHPHAPLPPDERQRQLALLRATLTADEIAELQGRVEVKSDLLRTANPVAQLG